MPIKLKGSSSGDITLDVPATAGTNTLTLPAVTDTLTGIAATQTLTNKTLTSPVISGPSISGDLNYTGTLTGGTGIINIGSGQVYKDASGNVGIGTSSPSSLLNVVSNTNAQSWVGLRNNNTGSSASTGVLFGNDGNAAYGAVYLNSSTNSGFGAANGMVAGTYGAYPIAFITSSTERMRIDSSGKLLLGTTSVLGSALLSLAGKTQADAAVAGDVIANFNNSSATGYGLRVGGGASGAGYALSVNNYSGTELLQVTGAGNVGIGTSSPSQKLSVIGNIVAGDTASTADGTITINSSGAGSVAITRTGTGATNSAMTFSTTFATLQERMRIDGSGNLLVGTTSVINSSNAIGQFLNVNGGRPGIAIGNSVGSSATNAIIFINSNGTVGSIQTSASATSYVTSSDYRLKNTIAPMTGALAKVAALKPCTYKWNADGSDGQGFIAHELAEVVPQCVTGEKDAVDADGNPVHQGIDTSFLVATLTAAIQEQQAIIQSLTDRVAQLEAK
jgi:hypothetical protein